LATEGLEKEWLHPDFNHNVLACLHIKGSEAGRIEVWDIPSTTLKHTWSHQNVTKGVWAGDTLCTFSEVDGVVNTWQCGFEGKRSQFTMEGRSRMECLGWRILQFSSRDRQASQFDYRLVTGGALPGELHDRVARDSCISMQPFLDGTLVLQYKSGRYGDCKSLFEIVDMNGGLIGNYEVNGYSIASNATFMNKFVVTCVDGDLSIWTREGSLVDGCQVHAPYPTIVDDGLGRIFILSEFEGSWDVSVLDMVPSDFTDSH